MILPSPTPALTWEWYLLIIAALLVQVILMLFAAPYFSGYVDLIAGKITGTPCYWPGGRWQEIRHQFKRSGVMVAAQKTSSLAIRAAFVIVVAVCGMVPVFSLSPAGFPAPGLLFICSLLSVASVFLTLPLLIQSGQLALSGYLAGVSDMLLLPALMPIILIAGGQDFPAFLSGIQHYAPTGEGAPFVLAGAAVFLGALWQGVRSDEAVVCPLSGSDRGLWLWSQDLVQLCWITLAGDISWSAVLAVPQFEDSVSVWLKACFYGSGGWVLKLCIAVIFLAFSRLLILSFPKRGRVRLLSVFLTGLIAWQIASPLLAPAAGKNDKENQAEHKTSWYNEEEAGGTP